MIRVRNVDPADGLHPNVTGIPVVIPSASTSFFKTSFQMSSVSAGDIIALSNNGMVPVGGGMSIRFSQGTGALTVTLEVMGLDQFGKLRTENVVWVADSTSKDTLWAYSKLLQVKVVSVTGSTSTIAIGINIVTGSTKIGLPIRPNTPATLSNGGPHDAELVALVRATGTIQDLDAIDHRRATVTLGASIVAGMHMFVYQLSQKGWRSQV